MFYALCSHWRLLTSSLLVSFEDFLGQAIEQLTKLWLFYQPLTDSLCRKEVLETE